MIGWSVSPEPSTFNQSALDSDGIEQKSAMTAGILHQSNVPSQWFAVFSSGEILQYSLCKKKNWSYLRVRRMDICSFINTHTRRYIHAWRFINKTEWEWWSSTEQTCDYSIHQADGCRVRGVQWTMRCNIRPTLNTDHDLLLYYVSCWLRYLLWIDIDSDLRNGISHWNLVCLLIETSSSGRGFYIPPITVACPFVVRSSHIWSQSTVNIFWIHMSCGRL